MHEQGKFKYCYITDDNEGLSANPFILNYMNQKTPSYLVQMNLIELFEPVSLTSSLTPLDEAAFGGNLRLQAF